MNVQNNIIKGLKMGFSQFFSKMTSFIVRLGQTKIIYSECFNKFFLKRHRVRDITILKVLIFIICVRMPQIHITEAVKQVKNIFLLVSATYLDKIV